MFQSVRQPPMLGLALNSMFVLVFVAFGLSVIFQGIIGFYQINLGGEKFVSGFLRLFSILPIFSLGYLFVRWFKFGQISEFDLKAMVSLTFGLYALSLLVEDANIIHTLSYLPQYPNVFHALYQVSSYCLSVVFALSLLKLSSLVLESHGLDAKSLRLTITCLAVYGTKGILYAIYSLFSLNLADFPSYSWFFWFGGVTIHLSILFLSIDAFRTRRLRKRSVYIAFFSIGLAYLLIYCLSLLRDLPWVIRIARLDLLLSICIQTIPRILSYLLVIVVSLSLMRGGRWEGRIFKLSYVAIFLYVISYLLIHLYGIYHSSITLIANPESIFEHPGSGRVIVSGFISLPKSISLLTIGLLLYREREKRIKVEVSKEPFVSTRMVPRTMFFAQARSVLTQKKVIGAVSAVALILLVLLSQGSAIVAYFFPTPSEWTCIAHYEDLVGDQIAPNVDINGTALGGLDYEGADILNVTLYSPLNSDELTVTLYMKGKGRAYPTIDKSRTRVQIIFRGEGLSGMAILFYDGEGFAKCTSGPIEYDNIQTPSERLQWISDNVVKVTYKGLPQGISLHSVMVDTQIYYIEKEDTLYKAFVVQELDGLVIEDYNLSSGKISTLQDLSKQLSPLYNSTMRGLDIQTVDVYRRGKYLNITVTLSDLGINDSSIPPTFRNIRCILKLLLKSYIWVGNEKSTSYGWRESGNQWYIVFNLADLGGLKNVIAVKVRTRVDFYSMVDGEIVDRGSSIWWNLDVCGFPFPPQEG